MPEENKGTTTTMSDTHTTEASSNSKVFDKHKPEASITELNNKAKLSWKARFLVFVAFPISIGILGLYFGYLETQKHPDRKLDLDSDFVIPFLLALSFVIVLGFRTNGFTTTEVEPLVKWPKVVRKKKIVRKTKDGKEIEVDKAEEKVEDKDTGAKKDD